MKTIKIYTSASAGRVLKRTITGVEKTQLVADKLIVTLVDQEGEPEQVPVVGYIEVIDDSTGQVVGAINDRSA